MLFRCLIWAFTFCSQAAADWNHHPYRLTFIELEGAMHIAGSGGRGMCGGEESSVLLSCEPYELLEPLAWQGMPTGAIVAQMSWK